MLNIYLLMATLMVILAKNYKYLINYLIIITGQWEYVTTPEAVLPNSIFLIPDMPLVPNTIISIFCFSAYSTISFTTEPTPKITSVFILIFSHLLSPLPHY